MQTNVLINTTGHARLSDFGLSLIHAEFQGTSTSMLDGAVRWAAPELYYMPDSHEEVEGGNITLSEQSDIYSFGSVMLQVSWILSIRGRFGIPE
jgi:serine/threonine protein kinase